MKGTKKLIALAPATVMALSLVACGSSDPAPAPAPAPSTSSSTPAPAPAPAPEKVEPITLVFCNGVDAENPQSLCLEEFGKAFEEATEGRYIVDNYWSNTLGDDESLAEMCRTNTVQGWYGSIFGALPNYIPEFATFALPYLLKSYDEAYEYLHNSELIADLMVKLEEEYGIHYVDTTLNGVRALTTKGTKVLHPDDMKGLQIRSMTAQVWQDVISVLGGTPVPIAYSELYVAMQTGVVDGQDNGIANVYNSKFYEVQDYYMKTDHGLTLSSFCLNADIWNGMSAEDQAAFNELWYDICVVKYEDMMEDYYEEGYAAIKEAGVTVVEQSEMDMQAFYDAADEMINSKYANDPVYGPIVADVRAYFGR